LYCNVGRHSGLDYVLSCHASCLFISIYFLLFQKTKEKKIGTELAAVQRGNACPNPASHI
jgi:hypothetical protein